VPLKDAPKHIGLRHGRNVTDIQSTLRLLQHCDEARLAANLIFLLELRIERLPAAHRVRQVLLGRLSIHRRSEAHEAVALFVPKIDNGTTRQPFHLGPQLMRRQILRDIAHEQLATRIRHALIAHVVELAAPTTHECSVVEIRARHGVDGLLNRVR